MCEIKVKSLLFSVKKNTGEKNCDEKKMEISQKNEKKNNDFT
jgi:hypothetical protein